MIINKQALFTLNPIKDMLRTKERDDIGVSYGLAEVGYDIRLKQNIWFWPNREPDDKGPPEISIGESNADTKYIEGNFVIASSIEEFTMPEKFMAIVHDKSTWARKGLSVFNTVIEPGWNGHLTLELVYHGKEDLHLPAGTGIAQVIFHEIFERAAYTGPYQNQEDRPVESIVSAI